jgi:hypothetical protein
MLFIHLVLHISQAIYYRRWSMLPTVGLGGVLELLGWAARLWGSFNPVLRGPFIIQCVPNALWLQFL